MENDDGKRRKKYSSNCEGYDRDKASTPILANPTHWSLNPLLETKLLVPASPHPFIARTHPLALLNAGLQRHLILMSAAAGFGKTALLSRWVNTFAPKDPRVAWVSLDICDNMPVRFWAYVLTALDRCLPGVAARPLMCLQEESLPAWQSILTMLINTMAQRSERVVLILDNYDKITEPDIRGTRGWD